MGNDTRSTHDAGGTAGADGAGASPMAALGKAARAGRMAENSAAAARLKAVYELFLQCVREERPDPDLRPGHAHLDPFDVCANHLVRLFAVSTKRADTMIGMARDLAERCPDILAALDSGRIDLTAVERLLKLLRNVDDALIHVVQKAVIEAYLAALDAGTVPGAGAIRKLADRIIGRHDPDGIRDRESDAKANRGIQVFDDGDGMSSVLATLTSEESAVLDTALDVRADQLAAAAAAAAATATATATAEEADAEDPVELTRNQLRADALMSLVLGEAPPGTGAGAATEAGQGTGSAPALRPQITVIGFPGGAPGVQFPRTGEATIQALLDLLSNCDGATLLAHDPTIGAHDDPSRSHVYRPSAALERAIKLRDGTCRHPGCSVNADRSDVDHVIPFDHADPSRGGPTEEWNHLVLCRRHHRFKTFSGWDYSMTPDGVLTITTPDGETITTHPAGPLADFRRATEEVAEAAASAAASAPASADATETAPTTDPAPAADADSAAPPPPDEPEPMPTFFARRSARIRAERRRVAEARALDREERWRRRDARRAARRESSYLFRHTRRLDWSDYVRNTVGGQGESQGQGEGPSTGPQGSAAEGDLDVPPF